MRGVHLNERNHIAMRLALTAFLSIVAGVSASAPAPALAPAPFDGAWMSCDTYQGARVCSYLLLTQRGSRVCGLQHYFATNRLYWQRFVGTARANMVKIDRICGDPGSETDTYCAGQAPSDAKRQGWGTSDKSLHLCRGRIFSVRDGEKFTCSEVHPEGGLPKVRSLRRQGPQPEDAVWLKSCTAGAE